MKKKILTQDEKCGVGKPQQPTGNKVFLSRRALAHSAGARFFFSTTTYFDKLCNLDKVISMGKSQILRLWINLLRARSLAD